MKLMNRNIDMIATFRVGEAPEPHKFRIEDQYRNVHIIRINKVLSVKKETVTGNPVWDYTCRGMFGDQERVFVIRFNVPHARWEPLKM